MTLRQHLDKVFAVSGPQKKTATADYQTAGSGKKTSKTNTLDRDSWIAVLPEKNGGFRKAVP